MELLLRKTGICLKEYRKHTTILLTILFISISTGTFAAEGNFPAIYKTTTNLNVRVSPNSGARRIATLAAGTLLQVDYLTTNNWAAIQYSGQRAYVYKRYLVYVKDVKIEKSQEKKEKAHNGNNYIEKIISFIFTIIFYCIGFFIIKKIAIYILGVASTIIYKLYWIVCIPFYILNWLQRHLSKPWRIFHKGNSGNDERNKKLREIYAILKIPLYIALTPLRFANAFYYNIVIHNHYEMYNYILEVILPSNEKEGADDTLRYIVLAPWRFFRYVVWHGTLTFIESVIWTFIETIVPSLTLFHGTDESSGINITSAGRDGYNNRYTGIWNVGGGNFAGNGIYFAPARSTAVHYSAGILIVCRVSLGSVLDLGLAPRRIYNQCGHANAIGATEWGLNNGYVTGEWWRKDCRWWEYCMYDWQNRYNYSWRIRPLYILNIDDKCVQRVPGGMHHWLFRMLVIEDICTYLKERFEALFK